MILTPHHAKYFAHELTKRCSPDSVEKLAGALVDAQVDLNPHQVDAALFAFHSPLSKGAILADEVGLGKTIEAGLVLSQKWAERKRRILIIAPANLRKQWYQEMQEKFSLPCTILETRSYREAIKQGVSRPFEPADSIVICSYQFARAKADDVKSIPWDLVVIDEAHRLRNVYKPSNITANTLRTVLAAAPKLLLTATPLQNSLLELYGLASFIDEHAFGDLKSFRDQYSDLTAADAFDRLRDRIKPFCKRTLRRQVQGYVPYTARHPILEEFTPDESEDRLYNMVSEYLQRGNLQALPAGQRSLLTLVLRKLLASSSFAIAGALDAMIARLRAKLSQGGPEGALTDQLEGDYESLDDTADEWDDDPADAVPLSPENRAALETEIADLEQFRALAVSITHNAKGRALLAALDRAFAEADRLGAPRKAIIFTESRRTQEYLLRVLAESPYGQGSQGPQIVLFNGSNSDPSSRAIYGEWLRKHAGTDRVTGSRSADMRSALVDYFRESGRIMIATEAGAEGINLQFCSLVVNYDLPWNPQRIEQRIGRCHRYGQKHDVVVVNFLNRNNHADQRVFQLLAQKFLLFEGVFGASDEVLGAIESGVDFEKRIAAIYQRCRTPDDIKASFDRLQVELGTQIDDAMVRTRRQLLENFDAEVHEKLRMNLDQSRDYLNRYERMLMQLTQYELDGHAEFLPGQCAFRLKSNPFADAGGPPSPQAGKMPALPGADGPSASIRDEIPLGLYELPRRNGEAHLYRLGHPLALRLLERAKTRAAPYAEITFDYSAAAQNIAAIGPFVGRTGELLVTLFTVDSLSQAEDHLLVAGITDTGQIIDQDAARWFFSLPAGVTEEISAPTPNPALQAEMERKQAAIRRSISERNGRIFEAEAAKLDAWADDLKLALEREIKDIDRQIKEAKRAARAAASLEEKLAGQKQIKSLESLRNTKRKSLFEAQDAVDQRREALIAQIEAKLTQNASAEAVVAFRWRMV